MGKPEPGLTKAYLEFSLYLFYLFEEHCNGGKTGQFALLIYHLNRPIATTTLCHAPRCPPVSNNHDHDPWLSLLQVGTIIGTLPPCMSHLCHPSSKLCHCYPATSIASIMLQPANGATHTFFHNYFPIVQL